MTERLASCSADPNFAVICSFLQRFAGPCGISHPNFLELQEMLENTELVPQPLIDLHVKLLRKARKSVSLERWERAVVKFCHTHACTEHQKDGWEIERLGYVNLRLDGKLRVLKLLLEHQFDLNSKFKAEVNRQSSAELRLQPFGRDKLGQNYWLQQDEFCNLKVYREDADNETWEVVARDRESLVELINKLSDGNLDSVFNSEDSNSQEGNENIDTGQSVEDSNLSKIQGDVSTNKTRDGSDCAKKPPPDDSDSNTLSEDVFEKNTKGISDSKKECKPAETFQETSIKSENFLDPENKANLSDEEQVDTGTHLTEQTKIEPIEDNSCKTEDVAMDSNKRKVSDNACKNMVASSGTVEQESKRKKCDTEVSNAIEEKPVFFSGEGSGRECELGNPLLHSPHSDVSEAIEEPVMFFYGVGSGSECETGNPDNSDETEKSDNGGESAKKTVKKLEEEGVSSTNGTIDDVVAAGPNSKSSAECIQDDSEIDFLKTGFFFGPGTLAAKDKIPMGPMEEEEPLKSVNKTEEPVSVSETAPGALSLEGTTEETANESSANSAEDVSKSEEIENVGSPNCRQQSSISQNMEDFQTETLQKNKECKSKEKSGGLGTELPTNSSADETENSSLNDPEKSQENFLSTIEKQNKKNEAEKCLSSEKPCLEKLSTQCDAPKAAVSEQVVLEEAEVTESNKKAGTPPQESVEQNVHKSSNVSLLVESVVNLEVSLMNTAEEMSQHKEVDVLSVIDKVQDTAAVKTPIKSTEMDAGIVSPVVEVGADKVHCAKASDKTMLDEKSCVPPVVTQKMPFIGASEETASTEDTNVSSAAEMTAEPPSIETIEDITVAEDVNVSPKSEVNQKSPSHKTDETMVVVSEDKESATAETSEEMMAKIVSPSKEMTQNSSSAKSPKEIMNVDESSISSIAETAEESVSIKNSEKAIEMEVLPSSNICEDITDVKGEPLSQEPSSMDISEALKADIEGVSPESPAEKESPSIQSFDKVLGTVDACSSPVQVPTPTEMLNVESSLGNEPQGVTNILADTVKSVPDDLKDLKVQVSLTTEKSSSTLEGKMKGKELSEGAFTSQSLEDSSTETDLVPKVNEVTTKAGLHSDNTIGSADHLNLKSSVSKVEDKPENTSVRKSEKTVDSEFFREEVSGSEESTNLQKAVKDEVSSKALLLEENIAQSGLKSSEVVMRMSQSAMVKDTSEIECTIPAGAVLVDDNENRLAASSASSSKPLKTESQKGPTTQDDVSVSETSGTDMCNEVLDTSPIMQDIVCSAELPSLSAAISSAKSESENRELVKVSSPEYCSEEANNQVPIAEPSVESLSCAQEEQIGVKDEAFQESISVIENIPASVTSSCSEEACLDDDPPAITTLEEAMRVMEAAGAPVCLDDSDDDDDGHFEETTEHAEDKPEEEEEEEEEEEKSFFVFEGSTGGWKHATTGRKEEENKDECEDDMFSDLGPLASPPTSVPVSQQPTGEGVDKKSLEETLSPRKGTRFSRRRGGLQPLEDVDISEELGEGKDNNAGEKDPLAISDDESKKSSALSRRGRKRRSSDPLESSEIPDAEAETKRAKLRGRRPLDRSLRTSVEEQRAGLVEGSSEDVEEAAEDALHESEDDEEQPVAQAPRRGGWRGGRRGRGRRGGRGRGRGASTGVNRQDAASPEKTDTAEGVENSESPDKAEKKPRGKRKSRMLAELQVDLETVGSSEGTEEGRAVRTSRRIAQIRLKEQAERREIEEAELSLKERYQLEKEARKAAKIEKRRQRKEKAADSDSDTEVKKKKKKHKKEKKPKFNQSNKVWNETSSGSSSSSESAEEEILEQSDEDLPFVVKSDHEFSCESDVNDEEYQPTRRARTARRDKEVEEPEPEYPCKKCGKSDQPEWMLLCDKCDAGWHCSCLRPALLQIPEGDWFCPPCQHTLLVNRLQEHLQSYDVDVKRLASEEARRKFMTFIDVSVENILPDETGEKVKKKKKKKLKHRERKRGKLRKCQIIDSSDEGGNANEDDSEGEIDNDDKNDPDAEGDSDVSSSSESSSGTSTSESSSSSSSSLNQSSDGSEPIYQLRQRRQTNINYRFNEYDDLIKSAIQDSIEVVEGEVEATSVAVPEDDSVPPLKTVQSAGKRLEGEEEASDEEEITMKKPQRRGKYLTDEEEEEEPEAKVNEDDDDEEEEEEEEENEEQEEEEEGYVPPVVNKITPKGKRKKHRPLTALEVSSTSSDPESDEDFKGSSADDDEGDESFVSGSDSDDSVVRSRRRGGPVRRSGRNRMTRYDRDFIDDDDADYSDDSDAPRKKKKRKQSSERRAAKRGRAQAKSKGKKTKKKARKNEDSDKEVRVKKAKPKPAKKQVESGSESDTPAPRRTRGRRIDYKENLDSSEEEAAVKKASKVKDQKEPSKLKDTNELKEVEEEKGVQDFSDDQEEIEVKEKKSGAEKPRTHPRVKVTPLRGTTAVSITPSTVAKGDKPSVAAPSVTIFPTSKKSSGSLVSPTQMKTSSRVVAPGITPSITAMPINPETKVPTGVSQTGIRTLKELQQLVGRESDGSPPSSAAQESTQPPQQNRIPPSVPQTMPQSVTSSASHSISQGMPQQVVTQSGVLQSVPQGVQMPQPGVSQGMTSGVPPQAVPQGMPQATYPNAASGPLMAMQALAGESYPYQHYYHQPPPHAPYLPNPHHTPTTNPSHISSMPPHHSQSHHTPPHHPTPHHSSPHHPSHHPAPHHPSPHHHMMSPHHPNSPHLSPHHSRPPHHGSPHHHLPGHHSSLPHHPYTNPAQHALSQQHVGLHGGPQGSPPSNPANPSVVPQPTPAKYEEEGRSEFGGLVSYFSSQHDDMEG